MQRGGIQFADDPLTCHPSADQQRADQADEDYCFPGDRCVGVPLRAQQHRGNEGQRQERSHNGVAQVGEDLLPPLARYATIANASTAARMSMDSATAAGLPTAWGATRHA